LEILLPLLIVLGMGLLLYALVRSIDRDELRRAPSGLVSARGSWGVVAGGFAVGFVWGALTGRDDGGLFWLLRGLTVGLVLATAGAFYVGSQQRAARRRREESGRLRSGGAEPGRERLPPEEDEP
jgi:predicted lipid-binding transport protein (Tim44 family)